MPSRTSLYTRKARDIHLGVEMATSTDIAEGSILCVCTGRVMVHLRFDPQPPIDMLSWTHALPRAFSGQIRI